MIGASATGSGFSGNLPAGAVSEFRRIGFAMEAFLWAFLGGWAACYFASGGEEERPSQPSTGAETARAPE
jgi:hypothetical protein